MGFIKAMKGAKESTNICELKILLTCGGSKTADAKKANTEENGQLKEMRILSGTTDWMSVEEECEK